MTWKLYPGHHHRYVGVADALAETLRHMTHLPSCRTWIGRGQYGDWYVSLAQRHHASPELLLALASVNANLRTAPPPHYQPDPVELRGGPTTQLELHRIALVLPYALTPDRKSALTYFHEAPRPWDVRANDEEFVTTHPTFLDALDACTRGNA